MKNKLLERLKKGPLLIAEGYVFELERRGYIKAGPYVPEVVLDYPDAVKELSREFLHAGSDVVLRNPSPSNPPSWPKKAKHPCKSAK